MTVSVDCPTVDVIDQGLRVRIPGGATLNATVDSTTPTRAAIARDLIAKINTALAPLQPLFTVIDVLLALKDVVFGIKDAITAFPPRPDRAIEPLADLVEKASTLPSLIPQVSGPVMVLDILDVLIEVVSALEDQLEGIIAQEADILAAEQIAAEPGNESLLAVTACARDVNAAVLANMQAGLTPLNRVVAVLNLVVQMLGLQPLPDLGDLGADAAAALEVISDFRAAIAALRSAIPA